MSLENLDMFFNAEEGKFLEKKTNLLRKFGTLTQALLYSELFSPELVEVDGSVILVNNISSAADTFRTRRFEQKMSLEQLEASFNFVEVGYLFAPSAESNDIIEFELAKIMAEAWRGKLKILFADRVFCVSVLDPVHTGSVVGIGFYELR